MSQSSKQQLDQHLMDHFEDPYHRGVCELATHEASGRNPLCHDVLQITLRLDSDDGSIEEAWFSGEGCVVCEAAASMLMEKVEGMDRSAWEALDARGMLAMLGPSVPVDQQKCGLLPWRVLQMAINNPLSEFDEDGPTFGGPHLGEEN
ncbi:MAG: iron-sulfur cluster assembly scaffold protein [Pirellulaceae bacterium]